MGRALRIRPRALEADRSTHHDAERGILRRLGGCGSRQGDELVAVLDVADALRMIAAADRVARSFVGVHFVDGKDQIDSGGKLASDPIEKGLPAVVGRLDQEVTSSE